jgi:hypothetical protein
MTAANHKAAFSHVEGPVEHVPSSQSCCGRYTRQNAHASMIAATPRIQGLIGAHLAIVMAPDTPNRATAQGPIQHKPIKEAKALILMAPPVVAAAALSVLLANVESIEVMGSPIWKLLAKNKVNAKPGALLPSQQNITEPSQS